MATLSCACAKLPSRAVKFPYASFLVVSTNRPSQNYFHTTSIFDANNKRVTRKKRDRFTVLKALSSTVDFKNVSPPDYRFFDDRMLYPGSVKSSNEILQSIESGEMAADYILEKYQHLFPFRTPEPAWLNQNEEDLSEVTMDNLKALMKDGKNSSKVIQWYEALDCFGAIPLDIHNDVLEYLSFHIAPATAQSNSSAGLAEKVFVKIKEQGDAHTYVVYILGLLKHKEIFKAFQVFEQLLEQNISCTSLHLYNTLLSHVLEVAETHEDRWKLAQDILSGMLKSKVKPNNRTFIPLLEIASMAGDESVDLCKQLISDMRKLSIKPSLGIFNYLLMATKSTNQTTYSLIHSVIKELENGVVDYDLHHSSDFGFFHILMNATRWKGNDILAQRIVNIVFDNGYTHLISNKPAFFGNYIHTLARYTSLRYTYTDTQGVDELYQVYRNCVPIHFIPHDWTMVALFETCRNLKDPRYVPEFFNDMVNLKINFTEKVAHNCFSAMNNNVPKERAEEFLGVANELEFWMDVGGHEKTEETLSVTIKILCLCRQYSNARKKLEECYALNMIPNDDAMYAILELSLDMTNNDEVLYLFKLMADHKMKLTSDVEELIETHDFWKEKIDEIKHLFVNC